MDVYAIISSVIKMPPRSKYIKYILRGVIIALPFLFCPFIYLCSSDSLSIDFGFHLTTVTGMMGLLGPERQWSTTNGNAITKANGPHAPSRAVCFNVIGL